jgi:protein O-mannosyl-transferase
VIFGAVLIAYSPALDGTFLWDDVGHVTQQELRSLDGLRRIWLELGATQQYYPVLHSAFWLEHRIWGDSVLGYHLTNALQHSLAAFLLILILRQLAVPGALLAGLIFALHPVCVESVAWISEQKNTLSAVFYLASALVYLRFDECRHGAGLKPCATENRVPGVSQAESVAQPFRAAAYWSAFLLFICALFTKTVTATLPAALLVVFWWKRGRLDWRRDVVPLLPWFAVAALGALLTAYFERVYIGASGPEFALSPVERFLIAGRVIWFYLGKLVWPTHLVFIYPRWSIDPSVLWQYAFPAAAIALAFGLAMLARRTRGALAGFLFFCGTLVPVLGFVDVYPFRFSYVADHFQYLASLGIIVPVAAAIASVRSQTLSAAIVIALGVLTWRQSAIYQDAETLYRSTIARNPQCWMCYLNLGTEMARETRRLPEAAEAYQAALRIRPVYPEAKRNLELAHMKLGDAAADAPGRLSEAIAHYEAVLRTDPEHFRAHYNLGTVLMDVTGREAEAIAHLESAVKIQPESVEPRVNLGIVLAAVPGRSTEAIEHLEFALAKRPDLAAVREILSRLRGSPIPNP